MSKVPSLRDILDDIQDDVSDSDEGEFETIEIQKPVQIQRKPLLDIPDEYKVLNKPRIQENVDYNNEYHNNNVYQNNVYQNNVYQNHNKNLYNNVYQNHNKNIYNNVNQKANNGKILELTEANLMKASGESMISYDIPKYESIETKSLKSKKSDNSYKSSHSKKSIKSESSIDFSVGNDEQNRYISYDRRVDDDDRRSQISSLSAGSIKSRHSYVEKEVTKPFIKKRDNDDSLLPFNTLRGTKSDEQSIISKISKKSHISISSMSSIESNISKKSIKSVDEKPLIQSLYPKRVDQSPMAFDKFSNQNKQEVETKVDIKRIKNIDEFKAKINYYIKLDDEIKTLSDALRERRKEKQKFEGELLNFMKEHQIDSIKSKQDNSQIELVQKKRTEGLNKEYLMNTLLELLKNKSTAENITNYVYSKRGVIETEKIKRVVEGKKKKRDKY